MIVDPEGQVLGRGRGSRQEAEEKPDQGRVAVHEDHAVAASMRFVLGALAPVGDGTGDQELAIGEGADLGGGGLAGRLAAGLAETALGGPVALDALGRPLPAFGVAEPGRAGQVTDPAGHRALGHA